MDHNARTSSSGRRRNVVNPGRIDTLLRHDRQALRLNFDLDLAMKMHRRSYSSAFTAGRPIVGGTGSGNGGGGKGGRGRGMGVTSADSSEALTPSASGSVGRSQGAYSQGQNHGIFHSQGVSLSQSLSDTHTQTHTGGFGLSQPSPDLLAPYSNTHHAQYGGQTGAGAGAGAGAGGARGRSALTRVSGVVHDGSRGAGGPRGLRNKEDSGRGVSRHRHHQDAGVFSSGAAAKSRRQQDGVGQMPQPPYGQVRKSKGSDGRQGPDSDTGALQAFERILSEQFRAQVTSELLDLRTLVEATRDAVADQANCNAKISTKTRELADGVQESNNVVRAAKDGTSKALELFENAVPAAFLSLENRLQRVEAVMTGVAETTADTLAAIKQAMAASTTASAAATAMVASASGEVQLGRTSSGNVEGRRQGVWSQPQRRQQQQRRQHQHDHHQQHQQRESPSASHQEEPTAHPSAMQRDCPAGADESFRWTQPWGEGGQEAATSSAPAGTPLAAGAGAAVATPTETEQRGRGSKLSAAPPSSTSRLGSSSPQGTCCTSKDRVGLPIGLDSGGAVDLDTPAPPGQEMEPDSFNPFQEEGLAPVSCASFTGLARAENAGATSTTTTTTCSRRSSPLPAMRTGMAVPPAASRAREGDGDGDGDGDGPAKPGVRGSRPGPSRVPSPSDGSGTELDAREKTLPSPLCDSASKLSAETPAGASTTVDILCPAIRSRSRSSSHLITRRVAARQADDGVSAGITTGAGSSSSSSSSSRGNRNSIGGGGERAAHRRGSRPTDRATQPQQQQLPALPHDPQHPPATNANNTNTNTNARSVSRVQPADHAAGAAALLGACESAPKTKMKVRPAPARHGSTAPRERSGATSSGAAPLPAGYPRSSAATPPSPRGVNDLTDGRRGRAHDDGIGSRGDRTGSGPGRPTDRVGATRGVNSIPLVRRSANAAIAPSARSSSREGEDDEDQDGEDCEDSVGDPGLTVEAYMAKKRQAKRLRNNQSASAAVKTPVTNARPSVSSYGTETATPEAKRVCTRDETSVATAVEGRQASGTEVRRSAGGARSTTPPPTPPTGDDGKRTRGGGKRPPGAVSGKAWGKRHGSSWLVGGGSGW
eukprot:g2053.t1